MDLELEMRALVHSFRDRGCRALRWRTFQDRFTLLFDVDVKNP